MMCLQTVPTHVPVVLPLDVSELNDLPQRVESLLAIHGHVDIFVSSAGISSRGSAVECSIDVDIKVMLINYLGHVALTKGEKINIIGYSFFKSSR
jgi:dehydrogenase/reductase SDR family protein 7B